MITPVGLNLGDHDSTRRPRGYDRRPQTILRMARCPLAGTRPHPGSRGRTWREPRSPSKAGTCGCAYGSSWPSSEPLMRWRHPEQGARAKVHLACSPACGWVVPGRLHSPAAGGPLCPPRAPAAGMRACSAAAAGKAQRGGWRLPASCSGWRPPGLSPGPPGCWLVLCNPSEPYLARGCRAVTVPTRGPGLGILWGQGQAGCRPS